MLPASCEGCLACGGDRAWIPSASPPAGASLSDLLLLKQSEIPVSSCLWSRKQGHSFECLILETYCVVQEIREM